MALTPTNDQALLREVDDAVRQDRIAGIWTNYGRWIVAAIIIALLAFGGWLWWSEHRRVVAGETAEKLQKVMQAAATSGKPDAGELDALTKSGSPGYRASALLTKASVAIRANRVGDAIAVYKQMAADDEFAQPYRDLALVRQTALEFETLKPDDVIARLKPLAQPGNPWFGSAGEMTAIAHMKKRDFKVAGSLFAAVAQDKGVPRSIQSRTVQMATLLGVDATAASAK